jgi:hypothetical protein
MITEQLHKHRDDYLGFCEELLDFFYLDDLIFVLTDIYFKFEL